ncbi:MAG: hypothetical protein V4692_15570 [Bdellovibrionota bacterium]
MSRVVLILWILISLNPQVSASAAKPNVLAASYWGSFESTSISDRIRAAPKGVIDFLKEENQSTGWTNIPESDSGDSKFKQEVIDAIGELPAEIRSSISRKLIGILLVRDLGGTAFTGHVTGATGKTETGFIVLDVSALNKRANEWATWKEASPFSKEASFTLKAIIADAKRDDRKGAIQYILLHEFGHIVSTDSGLIPTWGRVAKDTSKMNFFNLSWVDSPTTYESKFSKIWPAQKKIKYYSSQPSLKGSDAVVAYESLLKTNYPTLYAATNIYDDFAESFANYVHVVLLKKPWSVEIQSGKKHLSYNSCWEELRCKEKKSIMQSFIQGMK